ncbi:MAG TPA: tetratricopeptide repeat protein [Opitutaceae bacterium]|nr:tetratricopeptide repeat protein [Opitutaceae bacterium]
MVFAGLAAFANSFRGPFVFDDVPAIFNNPTLRHLGDLKHLFFPGAPAGITVAGRPVLNLSLALCYALSGTGVWSYHLFNLLVHLLAGLALLGVVRRTCELLPGLRRDAVWIGFAAALLWLLHPVQTEAVTYVIQRCESLMGLFVLFTFYTFIRSVASPRPAAWRAASVAACLAAVGTKEEAAVVPLLVLLYDRTFVSGSFREAWRRRWKVFLCLAATWVPLALLVAGAGWNRGGTSGFNVGIAPSAYWFTQFRAVAHYLRLAFWPHPLVFEYGTFWMNARQAAPYAAVVLPLLAATAAAVWRWPAAGFLGAWFFVFLAPTSLVPGTVQMIVEHRMYLPLAAVVVGVVLLMRAATGRVWPCLLLAVPLGILTVRRNAVYRDDLTLWQQTVAASPASALAQGELGTALYRRHRAAEALDHYRLAVDLNPRRALAHYNLGVACAAVGRFPEAAEQERAAVAINPEYGDAHYQLGMVLMLMRRPDQAAAEFEATARLDPRLPENRYEWGAALAQLGRWTEAVEEYQVALKLRPGWVDAECDLGTALFQLNRMPEAIACFQQALSSRPDLAPAHFNLGLALARTGASPEAMEQFAEAVRLNPGYLAAQFNLGIALAQAGRFAEAIEHLQKGVELDPSSPQGHFTLGAVQARAGRLSEASEELETALRLDPSFAPARQMLDQLRAARPAP